MNTISSLLVCLLQVTLVATIGILTSLILRRWLRTSAGLLLQLTMLSVIFLTLCAFCSWPSWLELIPQSTVPVSQLATVSGTSSQLQSEATPDVTGIDPGESQPVSSAVWSHWWGDSLDFTSHDYHVTVSDKSNAWIRTGGLVCGLIVSAAFAVGLFRFVGGFWGIRVFISGSRPLTVPLLRRQIELLRAELGCSRTVRLRETSKLALAATVGWRHPVVLLSENWKTWTDAQLRSVLAHEIAHVARGDFIASVAAQLGLLLHYYHPLVHWLANRLRLEQELAADAMAARVIGNSQAYLCAIGELALNQTPEPLGWSVHAFLPTQRTFLRRIEMLRDPKNMTRRASLNGRWWTIICVAVVTLLAAGFRPAEVESDSGALSAQEATVESTKPIGNKGSTPFWTADPLATVLDAWDKKAPAMSSVECSWLETRVYGPGSVISPEMVVHLGLAEDILGIDRNVGWPSDVTEVSRQRVMRLMGKWRYFQDFSIGPGKDAQSVVVTERISSNAGKVSLQYSGDQGQLGEERSWSDAQSIHSIPVRYILRLTNRSFVSTARETFGVLDADASTGLITLADDHGMQLVVDASKDFVVTRGKRVSGKTGKTDLEFEVSFVNTDGMNWRPTGWVMQIWNSFPHRESQSIRFQATEFNWMLNKSLEAKDFKIQMPKGIRIHNSEGKLVTSIEP